MAIDIYEVKKELTNYLRNQDLISLSARGVTTTTEQFSGNGTTTDFDLSNTNLKNVRDVQISSVSQSYGTDYTIDFQGSNPGRISFTTAPPTGTNNIDIEYDYGNSDRVFSDYPRPDLTISSYPRVGFDIMTMSTAPMGIGGSEDMTNMTIEIVVYGINIENVEDIGTLIRNSFRTDKKNFYNFKFVQPRTVGPLIVSPNRNDEVLQRNHTYEIMNIFES